MGFLFLVKHPSALIGLCAALLLACSSNGSTIDKGDLEGWEVKSVSLGQEALSVAVADEPEEWAQGLMGVDELGDLDGMLFVFSDEVLSPVWMKDTLIPLDIAFFNSEGTLVDAFTMEPCREDPCSTYLASAPFAWALETPAGRLVELAPDIEITVGER